MERLARNTFVILIAFAAATTRHDLERNIRLVNGPTINEGRIEILRDDEWGTVCDDSYNLNAAHVFCRMLGYTKAQTYYHSARWGKGTGKIWLDEVRCKGNEMHVNDCLHNEWGDSDCEHHEDAGVLCHPERIPGWDLAKLREAQIFDDEHFKVRLQPLKSRTNNALYNKDFVTLGYLELQGKDKRWRKVCANEWNEKAANVACGQLGFSHTANTPTSVVIPHRRWAYGMHTVRCTGTENNLIWCEKKVQDGQSGYGRCPGKKAVFLHCKPGTSFLRRLEPNHTPETTDSILFSRTRQAKGSNIRLKSGGNVGSGRVEVKINDQWGTICHENWAVEAANVACRQLGFGSARNAFKNSQFGNGHGPVYWTKVNCTGTEKQLEDCGYEVLPDESDYDIRTRAVCSHGNDVSVVCNLPKQIAKSVTLVRLSGGRHFREGRVEIKKGKTWGALCSNNFTMNNAVIICRQLGFGFAHQFIENLPYWKGGEDSVDEVVFSGLNCRGDEISVSQCKFDRHVKCDSNFPTPFTGLVCTERAGDLVVDIPLLESSLHFSRVSTGNLQCAAEENCLAPSAYGEDWFFNKYWDPYRVRKLIRFSTRVWNRGTADFIPKASRQQWEWHACHAHYHSMENFIDYDVLSLNRSKVAAGHKASFCLEDNDCEGEATRQYDCDRSGGGEQGISMGCADTYLYTLDCQWIDITDVPPGNYLLRLHANPNLFVAETDYYNNIAICNMILTETSVKAFNCHIPDDYEESYIQQFYTEKAYLGRGTGVSFQ